MESLIRELWLKQEHPCVSLVLKLLPGAPRAHDNTGLVLRALDDVEARLHGTGLSPKGQKQFLAPARTFAEEELPAHVDGGALALFLSPSFFRAVHLKTPEDECTVIGRHFHFLPLLRSITVETPGAGVSSQDASSTETPQRGVSTPHQTPGDGSGQAANTASSSVFAIIEAALRGNVERLVLVSGVQLPGEIVEEDGVVRIEEKQEGEELLGLAAAATIAQGGQVVLVEKEKMPGAHIASAVFRP